MQALQADFLRPLPATSWSEALHFARLRKHRLHPKGWKVSAGSGQSLVADESGTMFSFGKSTGGVPRKVTGWTQRVAAVVCNLADRSLALTTGGTLWTTDGFMAIHQDGRFTEIGSALDTTSLDKKRVVGISASVWHTMVVTASGQVFTWGKGEHGQLGRGVKPKTSINDWTTNRDREPTLVFSLAREQAVAVAAGDEFSAVLTRGGAIFTFGSGASGQLGHGTTKDQHEPLRVAGLSGEVCVAVSTGRHHTLVATAGGGLFSFGEGYWGNLGHGNRLDCLVPTAVDSLKAEKLVAISAGMGHSIALAECGSVFTFGNGRSGCLGHGNAAVLTIPRRIEALAAKRAVSISGGDGYSLVAMADGAVYSFGSGHNGQLGHGDETDRAIPKRIDALRRGAGHMGAREESKTAGARTPES